MRTSEQESELAALKAHERQLELKLLKKKEAELVAKKSQHEPDIIEEEVSTKIKKSPKQKLADALKTGAGMGGRALVSAPGQLADIAMLPHTIYKAVKGHEIPEGYADKSKHWYDTKTNHQFKPTSNKGKIVETALDFATPVGIIGGAGKLLRHIPGSIKAAQKVSQVGNNAPKVLKAAAKPVKWLAQGYSPTKANIVGGTAGSAALQHMENQGSGIGGQLPASFLADLAARKVVGKKFSDRRSIGKYLKDIPEGIKGTVQRSSLKIPEVKAALMKSLPERYGQKRDLGAYTEEAGKSVGTGISRYKKVHKQRIWNNLDKEIAHEVDPIVADRMDPRGYVPIKDLDHIVEREMRPLIGNFAQSIEKKAPVIEHLKELKKLRDKPTPPHHIPFANAKAARKRMDNAIKKLQEGTPERANLSEARDQLQQTIDQTIQKMSPKARDAWLKKNTDYARYANDIKPIYHEMKPHMEKFNKQGHQIAQGSAAELFNKAISDTGSRAGMTQRKIHKALLESGQKHRSENFAHAQIKHHANKGQEFDPETLHHNIGKLKHEESQYLKEALSPKARDQVEKLLDSVKGQQNIEGISRELADILHQNKIPTSWYVKIMQAMRKGSLKNRALAPEYQDKLAKRLLVESQRGPKGPTNKQFKNARIATQGRHGRRLFIEITKGVSDEEYKKERE